MGDINLLGMIRKIKNSLSGFVSTSDKATKSKFGIVKVGDNLSVSSGTISVPVATEDTYGVVKAGGSGAEILQVYSGALSGSSGTKEYDVDISGKTLLFINSEINNESFTTCISVSRWIAGQSASINSFTTGTYTLKLTKTVTGLSYSGSDRFKYLEVYAI